MKVKRLHNNAILPVKAHAGDLGYDLFACETDSVWPGETRLIKTGIAIQFPPGWGAVIKDRSSVATKRNIFTVAGVIDNGYIGEIQVAMFNGGEHIQSFAPGDKIAQLVFIPTVHFSVEEVDNISSNDGRDDKGFGSTGT